TAMLSVVEGTDRLDGIERMRERPLQHLLDALRQLGVDARSEKGNGCPPVVLQTAGLAGGNVAVKSDVSSQYLSALLMAAPYSRHPLTIQIEGELVSEPYIGITLKMMQAWGVPVVMHQHSYRVASQPYQAREYLIEPDASSASYFWAAAAITGGSVTVPGLEQSMQGDAQFFRELIKMGCQPVDDATLQGSSLQGITTDMNAISDTVMTLAVVALFAEGSTTITNVAHIRHKETDRLAALATELRKVGAEVEEFADGLTIHPRPLHGATLDTYNDHRMAMSLSLIGLRIPGIRIRNPGCVAKTFPNYWQSLENLRQ
ncbi:MAG TPA: 3-phosphoshikimate 1-carboxyvinyltransferase, partial [Gemmatales bacterium]|nr:3-phosphoshikimate 1-carboxyvinyltransferase [Gemmatales bacterium]